MKESKLNLKGSPSRDEFKSLHKLKLPPSFYCADLDLVLVAKDPARILAFLDFKRMPGDSISFSEGIIYNILSEIASVYIIEASNPTTGPFRVRLFLRCNWHPEPPIVTYGEEVLLADWGEFSAWETKLRR